MRKAHRASLIVLASAVLPAIAPLVANADPIFSDNFNTSASSSNYNVFQTTGAGGANTSTAVFAFDYSALGIPSAPNSLSDSSTTGLRVQSDDTVATSSDIIGAISVVTKGLTLPSQYKVSVEVWANYVGDSTGLPGTNGSNSSTGPTIGIGSAGTSYDEATTNAAQGGILFDAIRDATASGGTYRVYINGTNEGNTANTFYAAGPLTATDLTPSQYSTADSGGFYKKLFPAVSAPSIQSSAASTQTGATLAGEFGFAWHNETITQDGTNVTWAIDGTTIATIPDSAVTKFGGSQIALGDQDSNTGTGPTTYNFDIFDDLTVTAIPEPTSLGLLGLGAIGLLSRRRKNA